MSNYKKVMMTAAGSGGPGLDVDDVFNISLYTGNSGNQTITTGLDMTGEGGMTWFKTRSHAYSHLVFDTVRGQDERLMPHSDSNQDTQAAGRFPTFTSTGFTLANDTGGDLNYSGRTACAWSFRQATNFFKIQTFTGDGVNGRTISHSLGSTPGMIWVKRLDSSNNWNVWHRKAASYGQTNGYYTGRLDTNQAFGYTTIHTVTSTSFKVSSDTGTNASSGTYVVYLFAHHDGTGTFGATGDQDIISCGEYTGNGSSTGPTIDMGFEPQWLMIKKAGGGPWLLWDSMRGIATGGDDALLYAEGTNSEVSSQDLVDLTSTGFKLTNGDGDSNGSGDPYIYVAFRRSTAIPTAASDVFALDSVSNSEPAYSSGFPVDLGISYSTQSGQFPRWSSRLTGNKFLKSSSSAAEVGDNQNKFDYMDGWGDFGGNSPQYHDSSHMFKRAPSFMDVVCYKGLGGNQSIPHNLGVTPEFIIIKNRDLGNNWVCKHTGIGLKEITLNGTGVQSGSDYWQSGDDADVFYTTTGNKNEVNSTSYDYIAVLFSSLDGIAKIGSYTGNGSGSGQNQTIDCGFASTPRFIVIKNADQYNRWYYFDSINGINTGTEERNYWNYGSQDSALDLIDPTSSGFTVNWYNHSDHNMNTNGHKYIYYAVA